MGFTKYAVALLMIMAGLAVISARVCEDGWSYYEGKCYQYVNEQVPMEEAFSKCNDKSSWVAKVDNQGENDFIGSLAIDGVLAIGLRRDSRSEFRWIDGTRPSYTNWAVGEPNNSGGNEDCTMMYIGREEKRYQWNDCPCSSTMQFVCEKDASVPPECHACAVAMMNQ